MECADLHTWESRTRYSSSPWRDSIVAYIYRGRGWLPFLVINFHHTFVIAYALVFFLPYPFSSVYLCIVFLIQSCLIPTSTLTLLQQRWNRELETLCSLRTRTRPMEFSTMKSKYSAVFQVAWLLCTKRAIHKYRILGSFVQSFWLARTRLYSTLGMFVAVKNFGKRVRRWLFLRRRCPRTMKNV